MSRLSPVNQARWARFRHNRRGYWSLWIFAVLFALSMCSELIANDKPCWCISKTAGMYRCWPPTAKAILAARLRRQPSTKILVT